MSEIIDFNQMCSTCGKIFQEEFENKMDGTIELLQQAEKELKFIEIIKQKHLVCSQIEKLSSVGLGERDLIVILQDRTKLNKTTIKNFLDVLRDFEDTEFSNRLNALESLLTNLKNKVN